MLLYFDGITYCLSMQCKNEDDADGASRCSPWLCPVRPFLYNTIQAQRMLSTYLHFVTACYVILLTGNSLVECHLSLHCGDRRDSGRGGEGHIRDIALHPPIAGLIFIMQCM